MWVFPVLWKKAQGGVVIYLRHLACWETLGWELRARARHVTQTDGDFLKFSRCFGGLKSWNLHIFWVLKMLLTILVSETMAFFWVFFSLFHTLKSDPSTFFLTKKKHPKSINFDEASQQRHVSLSDPLRTLLLVACPRVAGSSMILQISTMICWFFTYQKSPGNSLWPFFGMVEWPFSRVGCLYSEIRLTSWYGSLSHYIQGFIDVRWLFWISEPSTVSKDSSSIVTLANIIFLLNTFMKLFAFRGYSCVGFVEWWLFLRIVAC